MAQTRFMASLQPCFLRERGWWTWFVNSTRWGVGLVNAIFGKADEALRKRAAYKERKSDKGFENLEYESRYAGLARVVDTLLSSLTTQ
jgi:hypothetical protein